MNRTNTIIAAGFLIIILGAVFVFLGMPGLTDSGSHQQVPEEWETYAGDQFDFTFRYPPRAKIDVADPAPNVKSKRVRVRLIGPQSKPNTEITDGFVFYVQMIPWPDQESSEESASQIFEMVTRQEEVVEGLARDTEISGREAYRFSIQTQLGDTAQYKFVKTRNQSAILLSYVINHPDSQDQKYLEIINMMIQTLNPLSGNS